MIDLEKTLSLFDTHWALVTAGCMEDFNGCTVSWGSLGNIWGSGESSRGVVTVYVHPARYTWAFLRKSPYFTVSFFPKALRPALTYMGTHSGRRGDKTAAAGLTPLAFGQSVTYEEAETALLCQTLCQQPFSREGLCPQIQAYYAAAPGNFPDGSGGWQPHWMFIGQVVAIRP